MTPEKKRLLPRNRIPENTYFLRCFSKVLKTAFLLGSKMLTPFLVRWVFYRVPKLPVDLENYVEKMTLMMNVVASNFQEMFAFMFVSTCT